MTRRNLLIAKKLEEVPHDDTQAVVLLKLRFVFLRIILLVYRLNAESVLQSGTDAKCTPNLVLMDLHR